MVNALTFTLVARAQQLGGRYAETVSDLDAEIQKLDATVAANLALIGVKE